MKKKEVLNIFLKNKFMLDTKESYNMFVKVYNEFKKSTIKEEFTDEDALLILDCIYRSCKTSTNNNGCMITCEAIEMFKSNDFEKLLSILADYGFVIVNENTVKYRNQIDFSFDRIDPIMFLLLNSNINEFF